MEKGYRPTAATGWRLREAGTASSAVAPLAGPTSRSPLSPRYQEHHESEPGRVPGVRDDAESLFERIFREVLAQLSLVTVFLVL